MRSFSNCCRFAKQTQAHQIKGCFAEGGIPYVCGGYHQDGDTYSDLCYKYVAALDDWDISGTMSEERRNSGYGSSESWGLVMTGGYTSNAGDLSLVKKSDVSKCLFYRLRLPIDS